MTNEDGRTDTEIALARLRVDVLNALEFGATREQIVAEVDNAQRIAETRKEASR